MSPEIVLGPPGTGKTTRLLEMVDDELASGVDPERIGYVSFTKRAAKEATERAAKKFSLDTKRLKYFRTLHSLCFDAVGLSNTDVFEKTKVQEFGDWIGVRVSSFRGTEEGSTFGYNPGDRAMHMENLARVKMIDLRDQYEENHDGLSWGLVRHISMGLKKYKEAEGLSDFTDMLQKFVDQDWSPNLEVLFVDEAQDLSMLQWAVVWKLARRSRRVVVAGDDDQAIYRWAGAATDYFVDMKGRASVLGQSWRVPKLVQEVANHIILGVKHRRSKEWRPRDDDGIVSRLPHFGEVDVWGKDILILARNQFVLEDYVEPALKADGVIYEKQGGGSSVRATTLDAVRAWETLRAGGSVTVDDARRVYDRMSSGLGVRRGYKKLPTLDPAQAVTLGDLTEHGGLLRDDIWHEALDRIPTEERVYLLRARQKGEATTSRPRVRLSTIHGSKGGEADHVVLLTDVARRTHEESFVNPEDEARVWYVATTRAKSQLSIVAPSTSRSYRI